MSSHHFVKEGQEPALFILEAISFQRIEPLLEWAPLIMVADNALEEVLPWGIKIDVVLQREHALAALENEVRDQFPIQVIPSKKDDAISNGLQFLIEKGIKFVNVIATPTEEIFQSLNHFVRQLQIGLYVENEKWSLVRTGKLEKWMPAGYKVSLKYPVGSLSQIENLRQKGEIWETMESGIVIIKSAIPFWICEPYE